MATSEAREFTNGRAGVLHPLPNTPPVSEGVGTVDKSGWTILKPAHTKPDLACPLEFGAKTHTNAPLPQYPAQPRCETRSIAPPNSLSSGARRQPIL